MAISYCAEGVKVPVLKRREVSSWIRSVAAKYGKKCGEIAYIFCDDEKILEVNRTYLQHDYYTDVITFDYSEGNVISGDIFISLDTVKSNAAQYGQAYETRKPDKAEERSQIPDYQNLRRRCSGQAENILC